MQPAWKMIYLARCNPTLAPEAFPQAWREHSALGRQCRNVQDKVLGVAQCSRLLDLDIPGVSRDYDGVGLLRLRDRQAATDIWSDPETLAVMRPDELRVFSSHVRDFSLVAEEHVQRSVDTGSEVVLYGFLHRRAGLSPQAFATSWLDGSARWRAGAVPARATGVVHNLVVEPPPPGYAYDGVTEWWFASPASLRAVCTGGGLAHALPADYAALIDPAGSVFLATRVTHRRP